MDCKPAEVDLALVAAHNAVATLKRFVVQEELVKLQEFRKRDGVRLRPDMPTPRSFREQIFDGVMQWVRCTVADAQSGFLIPSPEVDGVHSLSQTQQSSHATLAVVLQMMAQQMEHDRKAKEFNAATVHTFNQTLNGYREENRAIDAYKDRIIELQAVINHTKRYSEIDTEIGAALKPKLVPSDCVPSEGQRRKEVANELASVTSSMKDKLQRVEAENAKLISEKLYTAVENKLLSDRVRVLEAQLAVLNASSAVSLRELSKTREENARHLIGGVPPGAALLSSSLASGSPQPPSPTKQPTSPRDVEINGLIIHRDVAKWLVEVYKALLENPEAAEKLQALRQLPSVRGGSSAGSTRPAAVSGSLTRAADSARSSASVPGSVDARDRVGSAQQRLGSARSFAEHVSAVRSSSAGTTGSAQSDL
jgi:hypothetical protein